MMPTPTGLRNSRATGLASVALVALATFAVAETKKDYRFEVGPHAKVSIVNQFGKISVKPSTGNFVMVTATSYSDKVEVDQSQNGSRIDVQSHLLAGASAENARVDYDVLVPVDTSVDIESSTGPLR